MNSLVFVKNFFSGDALRHVFCYPPGFFDVFQTPDAAKLRAIGCCVGSTTADYAYQLHQTLLGGVAHVALSAQSQCE